MKRCRRCKLNIVGENVPYRTTGAAPNEYRSKGHVLLCKTEHNEAALRDEKTGDLTDYGVNCEDYYHANDGWRLLRYADVQTTDTYPPCWCVADVDYFCPANPIGWVLDLGLPKDTENELREEG